MESIDKCYHNMNRLLEYPERPNDVRQSLLRWSLVLEISAVPKLPNQVYSLTSTKVAYRKSVYTQIRLHVRVTV